MLDKRGESDAGWRSGEKGSNRAATAHQPQPRTYADGLEFRVTTAAAVCAASCKKGAGDSPSMEGGGPGRVGPLHEVDREDERGTGEARDPFVLRPGGESPGCGC